MRRRSRESRKTDAGVPATSSGLSKRVAKQSREVGTVRPHTAGLEPREVAPTAGARKGDREVAGEIRRLPNRVFVLDAEGKPMAPCHAARARELLDRGGAHVEETCPFAIRLTRAVAEPVVDKATIKLDSGAKHLGFAVMGETGMVHLMGQLDYRTDIKDRLDWRRACRRNRRSRKTRYRKPRFDNRRRPEGWLPPSLRHRVETAVKLARRLARFFVVDRIVVETASFDTHRLMNPEVHGEGYQKGPLYRMDLRRYLFEKHRGRCAYCKDDLGDRWEADHVQPKSRGGSDRPFNRVAACAKCNQEKGNRTAEEFGHPEMEAVARASYAPAAIVTSLKTALVKELSEIASVTETDGATTARNRRALGIPKSHANDAACLLEAPKETAMPEREIFFVARAAGSRRLVNGPRGEHRIRLPRTVKGFRQWDAVRWNGRTVYVKGRRKTGSFLLSDLEGNKVKDGAGAGRLRLVRRCAPLQGELRNVTT